MVRIARLVLVVLAAVSLTINGLFLVTNQAWVLMGSRPEEYPEFAYLFVGVPLALAAFAGAASGLWTGRPGRGGSWATLPVLLITLGGLGGSALLAAMPFLPHHLTAGSASQDSWMGMLFAISSLVFLGSPVLMIVQFVLALVAVIGSFPARPAPASARSVRR